MTTAAQAGGQPLPLACWVIEQPTADASGSQGFAAAAAGNATVSRATYNANSQLLLYERYDNVAPTTAATPNVLPSLRQPDERRSHVYAAAQDANFMRGDLQTLTVEYPGASPAVAPQITRFTRYDRAGRVLAFTGADGSQTTLAYTPRGWLRQHSVLPAAGNLQITRYEYDAAGQLKKATLPDQSFVSFTYDAAHRLTGVADSAGNAVQYTLDNVGNSIERFDTGDPRRLDQRVVDVIDPQGAGLIGLTKTVSNGRIFLVLAGIESLVSRLLLNIISPALAAENPTLVIDAIARNRNKTKSQNCRATCIAIGVGVGGFGGSILGGIGGAGGGTLVAPGVGTVGGAGAGWIYGGGVGAVIGGLAGGAIAQALCSDENECEKKFEREHDGECVAIAGARYGRKGIAICQRSAMVRYAECLRFGLKGIKTPLAGVETPL